MLVVRKILIWMQLTSLSVIGVNTEQLKINQIVFNQLEVLKRKIRGDSQVSKV